MKALWLAALVLVLAVPRVFAGEELLARLAPPSSAAIDQVSVSSTLIAVLTKDANVWTTPAGAPGTWTRVYEGVANRTDITGIAAGRTAVYVQTMGGIMWRRDGARWRRVELDHSDVNRGYGFPACIGDDLFVAGGPAGAVYRFSPATGRITAMGRPALMRYTPNLSTDDTGRVYAWSSLEGNTVARYDFEASRWDAISTHRFKGPITWLVPDGAFVYVWGGKDSGAPGPNVRVLELNDWNEVAGSEKHWMPAASAGRLFAVTNYDDQGTGHTEARFLKLRDGARFLTVARLERDVTKLVARGDRLVLLTRDNELFTASIRTLARSVAHDTLHGAE